MAHGRRDYTWGVLQDSILPGRYSVNFNGFGTANIATGVTGVPYEYTVPAGKKLYVAGIYVTMNTASLCIAVIKRDDEVMLTAFFSFVYEFDLGSYGSFPYDEGEVLQVRVSNTDEIVGTCYVNVIGVIEDLV